MVCSMFGIFSEKFWMSATGWKLDAIWRSLTKLPQTRQNVAAANTSVRRVLIGWKNTSQKRTLLNKQVNSLATCKWYPGLCSRGSTIWCKVSALWKACYTLRWWLVGPKQRANQLLNCSMFLLFSMSLFHCTLHVQKKICQRPSGPVQWIGLRKRGRLVLNLCRIHWWEQRQNWWYVWADPNFYKSQELLGNLQKELLELALTLLSIAPSSAGLERVFSLMGFVHSDLRNRFSCDKVSKLAFCLRVLNGNWVLHCELSDVISLIKIQILQHFVFICQFLTRKTWCFKHVLNV